jgi:thymidylate synthase (FAD)
MRLIENEVHEYVQEPGIDGVYKAIRGSAATCYQTDVTQSKLTPKEFTENVILKKGHGRALEFGTVYLKIPDPLLYNDLITYRYVTNHYTKYSLGKDNEGDVSMYITTNMRVIMQGDYESDYEAWKNGYDKNWLDDLKYWCEPTEFHPKRPTFVMLLSRGASDDLRTHITLSSMCESTRWCNYSKGKYGSQLTGIKPYWIDFKTKDPVEVKTYGDGSINNEQIRVLDFDDYQFVSSMALEEIEYMRHAEEGLQAQQLKRLFPLWGKCELRLCGFEDAWDNFMWRRMDEHADPECKKIAEMIEDLRGKK